MTSEPPTPVVSGSGTGPTALPSRLAALLLLVACATAVVRGETWRDIHGQTFEAEAVEALGPFLLFSSKPTVGRWVPVQALPLSELTRFSAAVKDRPPRAAAWADARGALTSELHGHLHILDTQKLAPAVLDDQPEPAVIVALFMNRHHRDTWRITRPSMGPLAELSRRHPGVARCVFYGTHYTAREWTAAMKDLSAESLFVLPDAAPRLTRLRRFAPPSAYGIIALSRDGVPLFSLSNPDEAAVEDLWMKVTEFVSLLDEANPSSWKARAYYRTAERIAAHPRGRLEPELIGTPILPGSLARLNIPALEAALTVSAEGRVSGIAGVDSSGSIPPHVRTAIVQALQLAVLSPAIEDGRPVEGRFVYQLRDEAPSAP